MKGINPHTNHPVRGGWEATVAPPFTAGLSVTSPLDVPDECARHCTWVIRGDGRYHLKYENRMCNHGGNAMPGMR